MNIVILGYYGFGNAGDELILKVLLMRLRDKYPGSRIQVLSHDPKRTHQWHNVEAKSRWNPFSIIGSVLGSDMLVFGGGGLLQNQTSSRSLIYYLSILSLALLFRKKVLVFSIGVETINGVFFRKIVGWLLNNPLVRLTVRDDDSAIALQMMGVSNSKIIKIVDPVFTFKVDDSNQRKEPKRSVLFIPRFPCPKDGTSLYQLVRKSVIEDLHCELTTTLFQHSFESRILQEAESFPWMQDPVEYMKSFDLIISARFHGCVLAILADRPFVALGSSIKTGRIASEWGMPFLPWDAPIEKVRQLLKSTSHLSLNPQNRKAITEPALSTADLV